MLLFSRVITLTGSPRRSMSWAVEINSYVNDHCDLDVALWSGDFGYPLGTMAWSAAVESEAALAAETAKLVTDDGYFDMVDQAEDLVTEPGQDLLRELVHGEPGEPPAVGSIATITTATALVDRMVDAVGWAVDIAQHITTVTGAPLSVFTNVYGQMGEITWISARPDLASVETARATLTADADYLGRMPATKELFVPASGHFGRVTRIA